jgi:hypothetical protein
MFPGPRFLFLFPLAALLACGSSPPSPSTPAIEDWGVFTTSSSSTQPVIAFNGALQISNGLITGIMEASTNPIEAPCAIVSPVAVNGTLSSGNSITISLPVAGGTATITATLGANLQTLVNGTYQIVGGSCAMPETPMTIAQYAPISGTYTGTFSGTTGGPVLTGNFTVTAVINQSTTPSAGEFPFTGTLTVTGSCSISTIPISGYVFGGSFGTNNLATNMWIGGHSNPTATTISTRFNDADCYQSVFGASLTLTLQ